MQPLQQALRMEKKMEKMLAERKILQQEMPRQERVKRRGYAKKT